MEEWFENGRSKNILGDVGTKAKWRAYNSAAVWRTSPPELENTDSRWAEASERRKERERRREARIVVGVLKRMDGTFGGEAPLGFLSTSLSHWF